MKKDMRETVIAEPCCVYVQRIRAKLVMELPNCDTDWLSQNNIYLLKIYLCTSFVQLSDLVQSKGLKSIIIWQSMVYLLKIKCFMEVVYHKHSL